MVLAPSLSLAGPSAVQVQTEQSGHQDIKMPQSASWVPLLDWPLRVLANRDFMEGTRAQAESG